MSEVVTLPRFSGHGYVARLQRHGFEIIGHGGHDELELAQTVALARPGSAEVIKVGLMSSYDPWPLYAAWCFHNPGRFKLGVRGMRWHGRGYDRFYVATMDRLYTPLSAFRQGEYERQSPADHRRMKATTPLANRVILPLSGWYRMLEDRGINYQRWSGEATDPRLAERLAKRFMKAGLTDLAAFVRRLSAAFPMLMFDPQPHNWMFTDDGQLVLIDPFVRMPEEVPETPLRLIKERSPKTP